jgi:hypothetical protein
LGPRKLPAIKVETKIEGKKVSKDFKPTMNTSVFANQVVDLLERSDKKEVSIRVKKPKRSLGERILRIREVPEAPEQREEIEEASEEVPSLTPQEETKET